jgi:NTE family protein
VRAFVMSGGGNRGALQAGALLALFENGLVPDMVVGSSAGALNAAFVAINPDLDGVRRLTDLWHRARKEDFFPGDWFHMVGRLVLGQSLFPNDAMRRFIEKQIPPAKRSFGSLRGIKLYITAANLNTGQLYLWGEHPEASIVDATIASAAHPLAFPPVTYDNRQLVDGGVVANVPVGIAAEKGATEIYILNVGYGGQHLHPESRVLGVLNRSIGVMMYQPFLADLRRVAERWPGIKLHHINILGFQSTMMWELEQGGAMVESGYKAAADYLARPDDTGRLAFGGAPLPERPQPAPKGADTYIPFWLREQ